MTREEEIEILEDSKRQNEVMRDNPSTFWTCYQMADGIKNAEKRIATLDLALTACVIGAVWIVSALILMACI